MASEFADIVRGYDRTFCIGKESSADCGWWSGEFEKIEYLEEAKRMFRVGNLFYMKNMIAPNRFMRLQNGQSHESFFKKKFEQQIQNYTPKTPKDSKLKAKNDLAFVMTFNAGLWDKFFKRKIPDLDYSKIMNH